MFSLIKLLTKRRLSLQKRLEGYKFALETIEKDEYVFICMALYHYLLMRHDSSDVYYNFPEIVKYKPNGKKIGESWWSYNNKKSREDFLKKLIKDIEIKLQKQ
jgi:hypothetical protein